MPQGRKLYTVYTISNANNAFCAVAWLIAKLHRGGTYKKNVSRVFLVPHIFISESKIKAWHLSLAAVKRDVKACAVRDENDVASKKVIAILFECQDGKPPRRTKELDSEHLCGRFDVDVAAFGSFAS